MCKFKIRFIIAFSTFGIGILCASLLLNRTFPENSEQTNPLSKQSQPMAAEIDPAPVNEKVENWRLTLPTKKKVLRVRTEMLTSADGRTVKVTITDYKPVGDFITNRPFESVRLNESFGACKIEMLSELKVGDKIFGYSMIARSAESDEKTNESARTALNFIYRHVDADGDGKFETHIGNYTELVVPAWVIQ